LSVFGSDQAPGRPPPIAGNSRLFGRSTAVLDRAAVFFKHGAFSYVPKPFDLRYMDHLLAAALSRGGGRTW
jgi:hypothetical protein